MHADQFKFRALRFQQHWKQNVQKTNWLFIFYCDYIKLWAHHDKQKKLPQHNPGYKHCIQTWTCEAYINLSTKKLRIIKYFNKNKEKLLNRKPDLQLTDPNPKR